MASTYRSLVVCFCASIAGVDAAVAVNRPPARMLDFTVFAAEPMPRLAYRPREDAPRCRVTLYPTARSARLAYAGPKRLEFFDFETGKAIAAVDLPEDIAHPLIVLSAGRAAGGVTARLIDDGPSRHGRGEIRLLNLSGLDLAGHAGDRDVTLGNGAEACGRAVRTAVISLMTEFHGRAYRSFHDAMACRENERILVLFLPPYRAGSLEIQSRVLHD